MIPLLLKKKKKKQEFWNFLESSGGSKDFNELGNKILEKWKEIKNVSSVDVKNETTLKTKQQLLQEQLASQVRTNQVAECSLDETKKMQAVLQQYGYDSTQTDENGDILIVEGKESEDVSDAWVNNNSDRVKKQEQQQRHTAQKKHEQKVQRDKDAIEKDKMAKEKRKRKTHKKEKRRGAG